MSEVNAFSCSARLGLVRACVKGLLEFESGVQGLHAHVSYSLSGALQPKGFSSTRSARLGQPTWLLRLDWLRLLLLLLLLVHRRAAGSSAYVSKAKFASEEICLTSTTSKIGMPLIVPQCSHTIYSQYTVNKPSHSAQVPTNI
jgi:hypothetical protein